MLVVCGSVSGAPGVSTVALGLAAGWLDGGGLLVEADPSGGVVAARFGLAQQPGVAALATAARHGGPVTGLGEYVRRLPLGVDVVVGPGSAETAGGAVAVLARHPDTALGGLAPVVLADAGRLYLGSPATGLLPAADAVVVVVNPTVEGLDHLDARLPALAEAVRPGRLGVVLAGRGRYPMAEVADRLGVPVWARLPRDRWGAGVLSGRLTGRTWRRTRLVRTLRDLAGTLADQVVADTGAAEVTRR